MTLSIGRKLGLGFGVVIGLMLVSATVAYVNLKAMTRSVDNMVDEAVPTVRACDELLGGVEASIAALRGFMILGDDPKHAQAFKAGVAESWRTIDAALAKLDRHVDKWNDPDVRTQLVELRNVFREIRDVQQTIEETAHTAQNIPSYHLLLTEAAPHAARALESLTAVIDAEKSQQASEERRDLLSALADTRESLTHCSASLRAYLLSGDLTFKQAFDRKWRENQAAYERAHARTGQFTPEQQQHWKQFTSNRGLFEPLPERIFALREADDWNRSEFLAETEAAPRANRVKAILAQIATAADARRDQSRAAMESAGGTLSMSFLLGTMAVTLIGSAFAAVLSRRIVFMVRALAERAGEIAQGNLTGSAMLTRSNDELGQLADGFDTMLANLKDLTGQILSVTENVNSAASQISSSARQQASSTKEQAATVQEITSTMQEIAQSGSQIIEKAREVATAAESAAQQSKSGIDAVQSTTTVMESIRDQVEEVAENIVALSEKTQAVGDIISTVNDIAEQSNLLALNATIEASEAGDEGNRFSVVATEMKNLADQAKNCTVQVRNILGEIQKGINSAVMLTEEAVKRVESGKQQADISEDAIRKMSSATDDSVQAFQQIIGATNQQQVGFEQVTQGMQDIDQATQQTASGTAQLEQAVVSLSSLSQQLKTAVSKYKVQA